MSTSRPLPSDGILGCGAELRRRVSHPYIGRLVVGGVDAAAAIEALNKGRCPGGRAAVEVDYFFEVETDGAPLAGLTNAAKMVLEHGTVKPWSSEGDSNVAKPAGYDDNMSWVTDLRLLGYSAGEGLESGLVTVAFPLEFFDRKEKATPIAALLTAVAGEPSYAFTFYRGAKIVDIRFGSDFVKRFPGVRWPHSRVRAYLGLEGDEPIIGTIVKPKTGLTPELFSRCVVDAASAGARFTKADENMHLSRSELAVFVRRTVADLTVAGFDLQPESAISKGRRFLFAPHITGNAEEMRDRALAAQDAGANALMFSPYHAGGFSVLSSLAEELDLPIYAHTAGMNVMCGCSTWGIDPSAMYRLSALCGAAFMQITAVRGYLKPDDVEKEFILRRLREDGLEGEEGMTLAIAGGLGAHNIGVNLAALGEKGRMLLAGTSVYSHPDGPSDGVKALVQAYDAYREEAITEVRQLLEYATARSLRPLARALEAR
jgi:ribulose-bisphosphate carboxylase large chain